MAEVAAVPRGAEPGELDDHVERFEQLAVMADDDRAAAPARQKIDDRPPSLAVEIVGRLVEQDEVGLVEDERRQPHPRALAARQRRQQRFRARLQAEPAEGRRHARLEGPVGVCELVGIGVAAFGPSQQRASAAAEQVGHRFARIGPNAWRSMPSVPEIDTSPACGDRSPAISLSSVLLPTPLRPTRPVRSLPKLRSRLKGRAGRQASTRRDGDSD